MGRHNLKNAATNSGQLCICHRERQEYSGVIRFSISDREVPQTENPGILCQIRWRYDAKNQAKFKALL
jgi:hypothetical protein